MKQVTPRDAWTGVANCQACPIRKNALFASLTAEDFAEMHRPIDQWQHQPGSVIYAQGDPAQMVFTLREGLVKLVQVSADGTQRIVRLVRPTDAFGLEATVHDTYDHSAISLHSSQLCRISAKLIHDLAMTRPELAASLLEHWHRVALDLDRSITDFNTGTARQRITRLMQWLSKDTDQCHLFGREDVGATLGLTTETVSRVVAELKRNRVIEEMRHNEFKVDVKAIGRIANGS